MNRIVYGVGVCLAVCTAVCVSAPVPGPVTTVGMDRGVMVFKVNGHPEVTQTFETYEPAERHFRQFAEAGCKVYGFRANAAAARWIHSRPVWVGPDVWDYSDFDEVVGMILRADPDALIIPRVGIYEPDWWKKQNRSELMVYHDGTVDFKNPFRLWPAKKSDTLASMASVKWRQDMAHGLRQLIRHIQNSPYADHVFGYQVFGLSTEEWYHYTSGRPQVGDYSIHMTRAFQDWLKHKYWTAERLRAAWNNPAIDFNAVSIPSHAERFADIGKRTFRNPAAEMHVIDFYQFYNEIVPETIDYFASIVKEETNHTKVVGAFYGYMYEFAGNPESGQLAVEKFLRSPNIDFMVVTASYGQRMLGKGGSILRSPHTSLLLHNKLWFEDNDNVSYLFPEVSQRIGDAEWERSKEVLAATDNAEETKWIFQRGAGLTLGNGIHQSFFDLHGGYFDCPQILADVKDLYDLFERSKDYDRTSVSEILVIADEPSTYYCTLQSSLLGQTLYDPPYRLIKCGAPYDSVYVNDLERLDTSKYKLFIVLNAFHLTQWQVDLLKDKLYRPGKTALWVYAPGLFDGNRTLPERVSDLTGMTVAFSDSETFVRPRILLSNTGFGGRLIRQGLREIGSTHPCAKAAFVADPKAEVLGVSPDANKPVLASKAVGGAVSVYSITASLPPAFFRELARDAGVHIYNDRDDTLYVSASYVTVNADGAGTRQLRFPGPVDVFDAITEERMGTQVTSLSLTLRDKETRILRIARQ